MISDILSMLNPSQSKQNTSTATLSNAGTLAKLSNEMKLIESLSFIKFQGSESFLFQGKPIQLLHASGPQQPFTLINTGLPIDVSDLKSAQLNKTDAFQASLTLTKDTLPSQAQAANTPQVKQVENLILASRVVNLTVLSTPSAAATTTPTNTPQTNVAPNSTQAHNTQTNTIGSTVASSPTTAIPTETSAAKNGLQTNQTQTNIAPVNNQQLNTVQANSPAIAQLATVTDGKTEFPIISQTELKRGDVIRVLVDGNNNVQVLPNKTSDLTTSPHIEALKQSLPKQLSTNDMSQLIKQLHVINESLPSTLPPQTQQALKQLMQNLPSLTNLTASPEVMKQAIQTSGVFSEHLLLNNNKTELLPSDLKLNLSRLKDTQENIGALRLGSIPTEQIANAIERITTTQLRHFADSNQIGTANYPLHIELPIRDGLLHNLVQIRINQDSNARDDKKHERRWLVQLKFDFDETGKFEARASIQGNKVSIIFVAEDQETLQKLQKNMSTLKQQLNDKDIEVEKLDTFQAKLEKEAIENPLQSKQLIDVRT